MTAPMVSGGPQSGEGRESGATGQAQNGPPQGLRARCYPDGTYRWGVPQRPGYAERWTPVRTVVKAQICELCWGVIPAGSPGTRTGERGTRAWYEPNVKAWRCGECGAKDDVGRGA